MSCTFSLIGVCVLFSGLKGNTDSPVIFAHQSLWRQRILQIYGSELFVIDSTYNTTMYDRPLFVVCVVTNVGYVSVASFLLSDERQEAIAAALRQICNWNPQWKPRHVMTDFHEDQISGVKAVSPGKVAY